MKVHLHGWFGFRNLGDDLLLQRAVTVLNGIDAVDAIEIGAEDCDYLESFLRSKKALKFSGRNFAELFKTAFRNDALVIGPGGLFPHRNFPKVAAYLVLTVWWKLLGKQVAYFGLGATSKQDLASVFCWKRIAAISDAFICRDTDLLNACDIRQKESVLAGSDLVFLGKSDPVSEDGDRIAVAFANLFAENESGYDDFARDCTEIISSFIKEGYGVDLLSFTSGSDERLNRQIEAGLYGSNVRSLSYDETLQTVLGGLGRYRLMLGMRFHSVLLASRDGIPFVAISYAHKTERLASNLGMRKYCVKYCKDEHGYYEQLIPLDTKSVIDLCFDALRNPGNATADVDAVDALCRGAERSATLLKETLSS